MGRYRDLPEVFNARTRRRAERAAINTPIQGTGYAPPPPPPPPPSPPTEPPPGGAADVVMMAMLKLHAHARLRELGWRLLLQIHDEVIMEGPEGSWQEAMQHVVDAMEHPFAQPLLVDLTVDADCADTWYQAK